MVFYKDIMQLFLPLEQLEQEKPIRLLFYFNKKLKNF